MQASAPLRLRQVALLARDLEATVEDLRAVFGIEVGFRDPGVAFFGLANAVFPVGDAFLEIVSPARAFARSHRIAPPSSGVSRARYRPPSSVHGRCCATPSALDATNQP